MPGRTSTRSTRPSTTSTKSAATAGKARASVASRTSAAVQIPEDGPSTELRVEVCSTIADSQKSTSGHRKLASRLRKIQEACCYISQATNKKRSPFDDRFDEADFNFEVERCVLRVLGVRKAEAAGDRVVRFLGLFLKSASEKDAALLDQDSNGDQTQGVSETPTSRLTFSLLSLLIPILSAKEKMVRFRATQIIAHVVNTLDSIDDELYHLIRQGLIRRIRDKEPTIRMQAVMGLGRLAGNEAEEEPESDEDGDMASSGLLEKLLDALQNDTSAEVRRSLLLNLPLTPATLPYLLERARDLDGPTRRALYARLLPTLGDFRHLSLSMREKLLRWGLRDRDDNVRKATGRLFYERWIEDCTGNSNDASGGGPVKAPSVPDIQGLLELLERIDVVNSGVETGVALEAMREFWQGRPDYLQAVTLGDEFWNSLTPESVFLARSFNDFCQQNQQFQALCEERMPEVTRLGFFLQKYLNELLESIKASAELGGGDEDTIEQEFILEQLLHIALTLDYSDEVGRRKLFSLLREGLAMAELPEEITRLVVETLRLVCGTDAAGEREFCSVVLEAIAEVHDNIGPEPAVEGGDDSFVSARSEVGGDGTPTKSKQGARASSEVPPEDEEEKVMKEIMINMKCLYITQCMLQNVDGNLQSNIHLVTMLNNLVVPAVRSHEAPIRERGLLCLGLCCLLDRSLAEENITLFIHCFSKGHENLQITAIQVLCDIVTAHPDLLTDTEQTNPKPEPAYQKPLLKAFVRALKANVSPVAVQSSAAISLSKLLLTSRLQISSPQIDDLLCSLVISFFDPNTLSNPSLRQSLAYFLPVFAHSRLENCARIGRIAVRVVGSVLRAADEHFTLEAEEDSDGEVDETAAEKKVKLLLGTVIGMLGEWTDGRKVVILDDLISLKAGGSGSGSTDTNTLDIQLPLASAILERTLSHACHAQETKHLLSLLAKLFIPLPSPGTFPSEKMLQIALETKALLDEALAEGVATDAAGKNGLVKVKNAVLKYLAAGKETDRERDSTVVGGKDARKSLAMGSEEDLEDEDVEGDGDGDGEGSGAGTALERVEQGEAADADEDADGDITTATRVMETIELGEDDDL